MSKCSSIWIRVLHIVPGGGPCQVRSWEPLAFININFCQHDTTNLYWNTSQPVFGILNFCSCYSWHKILKNKKVNSLKEIKSFAQLFPTSYNTCHWQKYDGSPFDLISLIDITLLHFSKRKPKIQSNQKLRNTSA